MEVNLCQVPGTPFRGAGAHGGRLRPLGTAIRTGAAPGEETLPRPRGRSGRACPNPHGGADYT
ncbi:hypothetical protein GCM10010358_09440 [Streptomyces minutiscleroticus]|uniref:Uncharacterized protein n=1 Tax=Streptomyces minutiscleroticus TaxID=68238 RepID=A0A918NA01_9ACTN|nr:hypothetical protein GCM10010358_09440 [Streptomyces minutiscleroticus]